MQVKLKVVTGAHEGKEIAVQQDKFLIGRSESCQLRPKSESVSRKHCVLVQKDGRLLALDLKSRNGTFINEKQLLPEKAKILKNGDRLKVGQLEFEVLIEVGLGGIKKPEVKDVKQAAERTKETAANDSRYVEIDINSWLEEADQIDRKAGDGVGHDTRQFLLDDTSRHDMTMDGSQDETAEGDKKDEKGKPLPGKEPLKIPKIARGPSTKNSRDAANETLKRYFGGRG